MKLSQIPFEQISNGTKTIEVRLNDEKRQQLKAGDEIEFTLTYDLSQKIKVVIKELKVFSTFRELFKAYDPEDYGAESSDEFESLYKYYTKDDEQKFGVLAIRFDKLD